MTTTSITQNETISLEQWQFDLANGNEGKAIISDILLNTQAIAEERARSEFLQRGYRLKTISFNTHRTDFALNDVINILGMPYLIKNIQVSINSISMISTIKGVRYE